MAQGKPSAMAMLVTVAATKQKFRKSWPIGKHRIKSEILGRSKNMEMSYNRKMTVLRCTALLPVFPLLLILLYLGMVSGTIILWAYTGRWEWSEAENAN